MSHMVEENPHIFFGGRWFAVPGVAGFIVQDGDADLGLAFLAVKQYRESKRSRQDGHGISAWNLPLVKGYMLVRRAL